MRAPILLLFLAAATPAAAQKIFPAYDDGAIVRNLYGPSDKTSRTISMRLYCDRSAGGSVYSKLGIFDVTDEGNFYGQYFNFGDVPLNRTFRLDDRTDGTRNYKLLISAGKGMPITFGRPGNEEQISTSRDKLFLLRARHAVDHGTPIWMGSQPFLIVEQAGTLPGFVFFPGDLARRLDKGDPDAVYPIYFVKTMRRTGDGGWINEAGPLPIAEVDGRPYELAFDREVRLWIVQEGVHR